MRFDNKLYFTHKWSNINGIDGMIDSSRSSNFKLGIDYYFMATYSRFKDELRTSWLGPYKIDQIFNNCYVRILAIDKNKTSLLIDMCILKMYKIPLIKEDFISTLKKILNLIEGTPTLNSK
jgi:hypothetical protein